jgi:hypothetical protein
MCKTFPGPPANGKYRLDSKPDVFPLQCLRSTSFLLSAVVMKNYDKMKDHDKMNDHNKINDYDKINDNDNLK